MAGFDFKSLTEKAKSFLNTVTDEVSKTYNDMTKKKEDESKVDPNGQSAQNPPPKNDEDNKV